MAVYQFKQSLLFPWMKSTIEIDENIVKINETNSILNIIPLGYSKQNIPIKNISSSMVHRSYNLKSLLIGLFLAFFGVISLIHIIISFNDVCLLVLLPIGIIIFFNGITSALIVQRSGSNYYILTPFFEQKTLNRINDEINERLIQDVQKTDLNQFFDKKST